MFMMESQTLKFVDFSKTKTKQKITNNEALLFAQIKKLFITKSGL